MTTRAAALGRLLHAILHCGPANNGSRPTGRPPRRHLRPLRFEALEDRRLLSGGDPSGLFADLGDPPTQTAATLPDLYVRSMDCELDCAYPQGTVEAGQRIEQWGGIVGSRAGVWPPRISLIPLEARLSADAEWSADDIVIGRGVKIYPSSAASYGFGQIPAWTPPGEYYLLVMVDPDNQIAESDETNNVWRSSPGAVTVVRSPLVGEVQLLPRATHKLQGNAGPQQFEFVLNHVADVQIDFLHDRPNTGDHPDVGATLFQVRDGEDRLLRWTDGRPREGMAKLTGAFPGDDGILGELDYAALSPGTYRIVVDAKAGVTANYTLAVTARRPGLSFEQRNAVQWPGFGRYRHEPGDGLTQGFSSFGAVKFNEAGQLEILVRRRFSGIWVSEISDMRYSGYFGWLQQHLGDRLVRCTRNTDGSWREEVVATIPPPASSPFSSWNVDEGIAVSPDGIIYTADVEPVAHGSYSSKITCEVKNNGRTTVELVHAGAGNLNIEGLSIAIGPDGQPAIAVQRVQRVATGSAKNSQLLFFQRKADGTWTSQTVASRSDGYAGRDGSQFTGAQPQLLFDLEGRPNIVFTDYASSHYKHAFESYGQIRHAVRNGNNWTLRTIYSQRDTVHQQMLDPTMAIGPQGECVFVGIAETFVPGPGNRVRFAQTTLQIIGADAPSVPPTISIADASSREGEPVIFTVTLSHASDVPVTVSYATANGSATNKDYRGTTTGKLTVPAGRNSGTISIPTRNDKLHEDNEIFQLTLTRASNALLPEAAAAAVTGTILDNDPPPVLSVADVRVGETKGVAAFTVNLSVVSGKPVMLDYSTCDGTAVAGSDYTATVGTLRFEPGQKSKKISVPILDDRLDEAAETFQLVLANVVNATAGRTTATGTIIDNDPAPNLAIAGATVEAGDKEAVFVVTLSVPSGQRVTVDYATANGTVRAGVSYIATSGTLTFDPGVVRHTIRIPLLDNAVSEVTETFVINLSQPVNASLLRNYRTATATIR